MDLGSLDNENLKKINGEAHQEVAAAIGLTSKAPSWRTFFAVHPAADRIPDASDDEKRALASDLACQGQRQPVILVRVATRPNAPAQLLDGRTRLNLLSAAGVEVVDANGRVLIQHRIIQVANDAEAECLSLSLNVHRRHLNAEQKRDLIAKLLRAKPEASNNAIAKQVKADDKTVASVRREMEARSEIPNVSTRTDSRGRAQPSSKTRKPPNRVRATIYRGMKLGDDTVNKLKGTSLDSAREMDALVVLNRGAPEGELTEIVKELVAAAVAGKDISAVECAENGATPLRDDFGTTNTGEITRKDAEIEELHNAKRQLEIKVEGLESQLEKLKAENAALRAKLEAAQGVAAASSKIATADTATTGDPGPIPDYLRRKPKGAGAPDSRAGDTLDNAVAHAFSELEELGGECREVVDNTPENLSQALRIQTLDDTATVLENLSEPDVSAELASIAVNLPKPRRLRSRGDRRDAALGVILACTEALNAINKSDVRYQAARDLCDELECASLQAEECEFPGRC